MAKKDLPVLKKLAVSFNQKSQEENLKNKEMESLSEEQMQNSKELQQFQEMSSHRKKRI